MVRLVGRFHGISVGMEDHSRILTHRETRLRFGLMKGDQFELVSVIVNASVTRDAITHDGKRKFLEFVKNAKHFCKYYDGIYILFYTVRRISEFVGLSIKDIDLKEEKINIDHQLQRTRQMRYIIEPPKKEAGIRGIPGVYLSFRNAK